MNDEIEALFVTLGMKPDDSSVSKSVDEMVRQVQSKLKSSIYGDEKGVITIPATIEGKYKNGREIEQEIKDAYAAIYKTAKQMADESVSLTLKDIENFKAQVDKFSRLTAKKNGNDIIANANNNLKQTLSGYQDLIKNLRLQVSTLQRQAKTGSTKKSTQKKSSLYEITDEEINDALAKENARQAKIKVRRNKEAEQVASKLDYRSGSIDASRTNKYEAMASEFSEYSSQWARELAKSIKENYSTELTNHFFDKEFKEGPKGSQSRPTTKEEYLNALSKAAFSDLSDLMGKVEKGKEDVTFDQIVEAIGVMRTIFEANGKSMDVIAKAVTNAVQGGYDQPLGSQPDDHTGKNKRPNINTSRSKIGGVNREEGTEKGVGPGHEQAIIYQKAINNLLKKMLGEVEDLSKQETRGNQVAQRMSGSQFDQYRSKARNSEASQDTKRIADELKKEKAIDEAQLTNDRIENSAERVADDALNDIEKTDAEDGFNSERNARTLMDDVKEIAKTVAEIVPPSRKDTSKDIENTLPDLYRYFENGEWKTAGVNDLSSTILSGKNQIQLPGQDQWKKAYQKMAKSEIERERELIDQGKHPSQQRSDLLQSFKNLTNGAFNSKSFDAIKKVFSIFSKGLNANNILNMNQQAQAELQAERRAKFGLPRTNDATATGGKAHAQYMRALYGRKLMTDPFKNLTLSEGVKFDLSEITDALRTTIDKNMFSAQTGGLFKNLIGPMTLYAGQPSLEKSRAQIDGLNTIMSVMRQTILDLTQAIKENENELSGMEARGDAKFDANGKLISGTPEAQKTFANLEEQKMSLNGIVAEVRMLDQLVQKTGGNASQILRQLGFAAPELRKCNVIVQNLNSGLDKNGKALHFQSRTAEILNYSFQLMGRHIGQMIKRWMLMMNPINWLKKAFQDFTSYDVKWQRTMNVIKYNLRRIIRPAMEWIAQQIVNIIGLVNSLVKGIGNIFGSDKNMDLFDQSAASAEQMREELEQAANVSAGFDELHDIGGESSSGAGDLTGEIYTPQWEGLQDVFENIGEKIRGIFDFFKGKSFWDWLIIGGAALAGFLALKALIGWFTGKNPLQSVATGLSFLEKAVGWALLIWAFSEFTKALKDFIDVVGHMKPDEVKQALIALAAGFGILVVALGLLMGAIKIFQTDWLQALGVAAIVAAFALLTAAIAYFIDTVSGAENVWEAFGVFAASIGVLTLVLEALLVTLALIGPVSAPAIAALGLLLVGLSLVIAASALFIKVIAENSEALIAIVKTVGEVVMAVLQPIMDFIDSIIGKIIDLAKTIAHEIGETIRTVIKTVGDVILGIVDRIVNAIPNLLNAIIDFCYNLGPAIENTVDAICRSITKVVNFIVSAVEYIANLVIGAINQFSVQVPDWVPGIGGTTFGFNLQAITIPRFVPQYEQGTNYVPNDGLAYLHQGEAVVPKKYNQPYQQSMSTEERAYMQQIMTTMRSLDNTMKQGIPVNGEFRQRGSDLVAVVNKTNSQTGADLLSNIAYAR